MSSDSNYIRRLLATIGITALAVGLFMLLWQLSYVLLLIFGGILFGVFLIGLASLLQRWLPLPRWGLVMLVAATVLGLLIFAGYLAGPAIMEQLLQLREQISGGVKQLEDYLKDKEWGEPLLKWAQEQWQQAPLSPRKLMGEVTGVFSTLFGSLTDLFVILFIGFYLALHPKPYMKGLLFLFPSDKRSRLKEVMHSVYYALKLWLIGRATSMIVVGLLTALGLWFIDMKLIMALAFLAGLLSFVPFLGPIAALIPAVLVALLNSPTQAMYVLIVFAVVQVLESNVITPFVQKKAVSLPPAVMLSGQLLMGAMFGIHGLALSTPLFVSIIVTVQMLYVRDVLKEKIQPLGQ
ncbi:MAG TPA: AI-2E family transporter [Pseudoalteromonas prydzensis]|uniref:AI-2E family transporter n=1 Tax=Pseudoalteromonas prydzensis TaxID=182141 RepID=A0A7V1CVI3_9GAMM|nr:AI-2E family transporter [Pseudoalteromonas prydzensis]HEA14860.1 AI-2E family transporter [Pseudoalteromonas prydzensis]